MRTILLLAALTLSAVSAQAFQPLYDTRIDYATFGPYAIIASDLNNDGFLDLAVSNMYGDSVSLFFNEGNGTFLAPEKYPSRGQDPADIVSADFEGDGDIDLALINTNSKIVILRNIGDSVFSVENPIQLSHVPKDLETADLNGDGFPDLATAIPDSDRIAILANDSTGHFAFRVNVTTANYPNSLVLEDFDGDSDIDIAVSHGSSSGIHIIKNNGDFSFARFGTLAYSTYALAVADFDGDGDMDLASAGQNLIIFLNNGDATFVNFATYNISDYLESMTTGDIDNDGYTDLAVALPGEGTVSIYFNNGDATFQPHVDYRSGLYPTGVAIADLDDDGLNDMAVANLASFNISIYRNPGDGDFHYGEIYEMFNTKRLCSGDINNDGSPDLAAAFGADSMMVMINDGSGVFTAGPRFRGTARCRGIVIEDLNDDGAKDIAVADSSTYDNVAIWFNDGNGGFPTRTNYSSRYPTTGIVSGDFDLDDIVDLAVCDGTDSFTVFFGDGNGDFPWDVRKRTGPGSKTILTRDLDNDQDLDFIFGGGATRNIYVVGNRGNRAFGVPGTYPTNLFNPKIATASIGSDNYIDMVATGDSNYYSYVTLTGHSGPWYDVDSHSGLASSTRELAAGDFDLDGHDDAAFFYKSRDAFHLFLNNRAGLLEPDRIYYGCDALSGPVMAIDIDLDGDQDMITVDNQKMTVYRNQLRRVAIDDDRPDLPKSAVIMSNYPNPFNSVTVIRFYLEEPSQVEIEIYNLLGQRICTLFDGYRHSGQNSIVWDASGLPSGLYFARMRSGSRAGVLKMLLLK